MGPGHNDDGITSYFTLDGVGEFIGQRLEMAVDLSTMQGNYRIIQVAETPPTEAPAAAKTVLAEGETVCDLAIDYEEVHGVEREEPVLGWVTRGQVLAGAIDCPGMIENARFVTNNTLFVWQREPPGDWNYFIEFIPEAGGAWLGTGHNDDGITSYYVLEGDGELEGQQMEAALNVETGATTYRILQVDEQ